MGGDSGPGVSSVGGGGGMDLRGETMRVGQGRKRS